MSGMNIGSRLLPIDEMARRAGVTVQWLRDEANAGSVPCLRAEHRLLFNADVVERLLLERAGKPIAEIEDDDHCLDQRKAAAHE